MKTLTSFAMAALVTASVHAEKVSMVGATVINPAEGKVLPNATVVIDGGKIERVSMGKQDAAALGKQIDCVGKFILPGYIDTHVHFFQSGDLFTRPDGADLNSVRPYKDEVAWVKSHVDDVFVRYLRSGITSVRCWRTVLEFRSPQGCERDCESAARGGGRPVDLECLA